MMAVTVVCDEKSMLDKAREWGHSLLPHKAGPNDVGCYSGPLWLSLRAGFLEKREKGRTPVTWSNVKRQTRVSLPG
jgi:hypothetical protein